MIMFNTATVVCHMTYKPLPVSCHFQHIARKCASFPAALPLLRSDLPYVHDYTPAA